MIDTSDVIHRLLLLPIRMMPLIKMRPDLEGNWGEGLWLPQNCDHCPAIRITEKEGEVSKGVLTTDRRFKKQIVDKERRIFGVNSQPVWWQLLTPKIRPFYFQCVQIFSIQISPSRLVKPESEET